MNGMLLFLLYGMFSLFSLFLVVMGANIYRQVVASGRENTKFHTSYLYLANRIRMSSDSLDAIRVEQRDGIDMLVITEDFETTGLETLIYYYDGALRECVAAEDTFAPEDGKKIVEAESFTIEETQPGKLLLSMTDANGKQYSMHLNRLVSVGGSQS